jgi:hypothetical protein
MIGVAPMESIMEDILPFTCPFCQHIVEFYLERKSNDQLQNMQVLCQREASYEFLVSRAKCDGRSFASVAVFLTIEAFPL